MSTIPQIAESMRFVLEQVAKQAGETTGFIERERKFDGATFAQTLIFSWLGNPVATLDEMSQMAGVLNVEVTRQGLDKRFTPEAAELMYEVLKAAAEQTVSGARAEFEILVPFNGVYLVDSSIVQLPDDLLEVWEGSGGGRKGQQNAGVKLSIRWNWQTGELEGPDLHDARSHDQSAPVAALEQPAGSLQIADLGYFNLGRFQQLDQQGAYWLSRYKAGTLVFDRHGQKLNLPRLLNAYPNNQIERTVNLGRQAVSCRLVAQRLPDEIAAERREQLRKDARREGYPLSYSRWVLAGWMVLLTNVPSALLSFDQLFLVYHVRWQIELLFKLWKSEGLLDEWRTANPWRILCEFYAKLVALLIQHWLLITGCWLRPERSLFQACRVVQRFAWALAFTLRHDVLLDLFLLAIHQCLSSGSRISKQQIRPPTFQRLLAA
jgi:hypothetical protein